MSAIPQPAKEAARAEFYKRMDRDNLAPLWEVLGALVPPRPATPCTAALWKYRDMRPRLMEAGELISAEEAERRVLILENPAMRGSASITHSLYAGLQLILPGEVAPSHRHTQSALRFVLEGSGAYTAVDGERVTNVAEHPAFRGGARSLARLFDFAAAPENREAMTFVPPDSPTADSPAADSPAERGGGPVWRCWQIPRTHAELRAKRIAAEKWAELSFGPLPSPLAEARQKLLGWAHAQGIWPVTSCVERLTSRPRAVAWASAAVQPARHIDAHTAILLSLSRMCVASGTPFISTIVRARP